MKSSAASLRSNWYIPNDDAAVAMKDLKAIKGRFYIQKLIDEGEHEHQDFKFAISDARKIARSISAFANNDGGRLLIGVKDNGNIAGVRNEEDIYVIEQAAQMYCRPPQQVTFTAFSAEGGAVVMRAEITKASRRPVMSQEPDGSWQAYYRVKDENIAAPGIMVRSWRRQNSDRGGLFSLTDAESRLLHFLDDVQQADISEYMHYAHVSQAMAEDIVVRLCAMDILEFVYDGGGFKIRRK